MAEKRSKKIRIFTWNVNGLRAVHKKGFLDWVTDEKPDILCLQETKAHRDQLPEELRNIKGYESHFHSAKKKGYSGVAIYSRIKPVEIQYGIGNDYFDDEGRAIIADYGKFVLANCYFPNGGRGPERVKYKLDFYDELFFKLKKKYSGRKGIIVTGDYNTAHTEIDLARPKENQSNSGFLPEERAWIDTIINLGYTDVFRKFHPGETGRYTYWDMFTRARERNAGWRIDYFMVSNDFISNVTKAEIHSEIQGSDHCPVMIELKIK
ncbi:MAG: exodeoxyribonuclease III [Ignavibacteria bacterium]|jgi:exodeoxyribonuclease-3|nr:exodeoxyribonuclease III [Ignavibacteria bacterium]